MRRLKDGLGTLAPRGPGDGEGVAS
jgi:hypothetical protein